MKGLKGDNVDFIFFKQIMGSLVYLTATRHDIMHVVNLIKRFIEKSKLRSIS